MGRQITEIVGHVQHESVIGDIIDWYGVEVEPQEISFNENVLHINGFSLVVKNGRLAFAQALSLFEEPIVTMWVSHNSFASNVEFAGEVVYGHFNTIGGKGFGYVRDGEEIIRIPHVGKVKIGKDVVLHNHVNIDRGVIGATVIGDGCKIDSFVHVAHNVQLGKGNTLAAHTIIEGSCIVGDYNAFGTSVIVQRKVKIGSNNIFGSGCVVTKDVGDNGVYVGNPARKLRDNEQKS